MKCDLSAPNATRIYRIVVKGDLLYVAAHNSVQARSLAERSGYKVLYVTRWKD